MTRFTSRNALLLGVVGMLLGLSEAKAGFTVSLESAALSGSDMQFNYTAGIAANDKLVTGDHFTIYDFAGYVPGSITAPSGWLMSTDPLNTSLPSNLSLTHGDKASIPNLTFTYIGTDTIKGHATFNFSATSGLTTAVVMNFSGENTSGSSTSTTPLRIGVVGELLVPGTGGISPIPAPEPSGLVMSGIGIGLTGLTFLRRRRRRAA